MKPQTSVDNPRSSCEKTLEFFDISKSFFGVKVLKEISFSLPHGSILGLVGENGAGKSTLMNILGGNLQPDSGSMKLIGADYQPRNPQQARSLGVAFVHQELNLFSNLSVAENIYLTGFPTRGGLIRQKQIHEDCCYLLERVGLNMSPKTKVESLSAGERQLVEIAKALSLKPKLLILDEPTTSLTEKEIEILFNLMSELKTEGVSIIYISHALKDVLKMCDHLVVLRDGKMVDQGECEQYTAERLISLMVGREMNQIFPERNHRPSEESVLEVCAVHAKGMVHEIDFSVARGEVLGIAGMMGSGRSELMRILAGLDPMDEGRILLDGHHLEHLSPRERVQQGLAFVTENRREEGLCMEASIQDNVSLVSAEKYTKNWTGWLDSEAMAERLQQIRTSVQLTESAKDDQKVKTLSGGNQQKIVLAKWVLNQPKVLLLDEPTRGIDVGAKYELYALINQLAEKGAGILIVSSEMEELIGICDRILVMNRGEIRDEIQCDAFNRERILKAALHEGHMIQTSKNRSAQ